MPSWRISKGRIFCVALSMVSFVGSHILLNAVNKIIQFMDDGKDGNMCFLEYSRTFDVVYHRFLLAKLVTLEIPPLVVS